MLEQIFSTYRLTPILTRAHLVRHLQFCHALMTATDGLLEAAGLTAKRQQEAGHAEWLAADLEACGISTNRYDYAAASIAGAQYYWIHHVDPRILLGYCAVLECRTFTAAQVDVMEKILGPMPCVRFHVEHDAAHGADVLRQIEAIDDVIVKQWIYQNAADTAAAIAETTAARYTEEPHDVRTPYVHANPHIARPQRPFTGTNRLVGPSSRDAGAHDAARDGSTGDGGVGRA